MSPGPGRGVPASFGRPKPPPEYENELKAGGQVFHIVVAADVTPTEETMAQLFAVVRETTRAAVLAGYADAFAEMDDGQEQPGGGNGDSPPGAQPPPE